MVMSYGWTRALPISKIQLPIVYIKVYDDLMLIVNTTQIQLWSVAQHKIKLGDYTRTPPSLENDGTNMFAVWKSDKKTLAVLTSAYVLCFFELSLSNSKLFVHGEENTHFNLCDLDTNASIRFVSDHHKVSAFASDDTAVVLGLSDGSLQLVSWTGESLGSVKLLENIQSFSSSSENGSLVSPGHEIVQLEISPKLQVIVVTFLDGRVLQCSTSRAGLRQVNDIKPDKWASVKDAVCASIGHELQILAIGSRRGTVELFNLSDQLSHVRTISLFDWGYSVDDTGAINCISWTPDNSALAVGWLKRGVSVWSVSGCRLMCSIRQGSGTNPVSPAASGAIASRNEAMSNGVAHLAWAGHGFSLFASETRKNSDLLEFSFVKSTLKRCVSGSSHVLDVLFGEDRLLIIQFDEEDELKIQHLVIPQSYINVSWPVTHAAINDDGTYLAISGKQGVILYDVPLKKWRVFGDVMQERKIRCCGLLWLGKIIVICNHREATDSFELSLYPRYHLDESSLLCRKVLPGKPLAMDVWQDYILVAFAPFDLQVLHVNMDGELSPIKAPTVQLNIVRELSMVTAKKYPVAIQFVPSGSIDEQPNRAMVLRSDGELSVLSLDQGSEHSLANGVERFWLMCGHPEIKGLANEVSWWAYGHHGMKVWYPSARSKDEDSQLDSEIDFDREVYPLTICPSAGVLVGVSQRLSVSACSGMPSFEPTPQVQTILPGLLHHLLQRSKKDEALQLAKLSAKASHFSYSLEWLLFTVFDAAISSQSMDRKDSRGNLTKKNTALLEQVCDLIRSFPEFPDVVVSVARKTDGRHWPLLFAAAGESSTLFEECFERKSYHTATCYILVIAKMEGPIVSQRVAIRLLQATLDEGMYELAGELVQFLLRIGRDYQGADKDASRNTGPLAFFLKLPSSNAKRPLSENDVLTSTVRGLLEDHAGNLMTRKRLSDLVSFVKETQFNIAKFLQAEKDKSAKLEDFPSALRTVNEKLPMNVLQSRLDAEFLLAHMCTVGLREWIVVLATILRRVEPLVELFRSDMSSSWHTYKNVLNSHPDFLEFQDFLLELENLLT